MIKETQRTLPCPLCKSDHKVAVSRNRSKCKVCKTWLQINDSGEGLQDFYVATNKVYLHKFKTRQLIMEQSK